MNLEILYPGGLKPFHDGHFSLLERCVSNSEKINKLHIIISPFEREGIDAISTLNFIKKLKINKDIEILPQISTGNPMLACYSICGHCNNIYTKFSLLSSNKGDDAKRVKYFKSLFNEGGKYYNNIDNKVIDFNIDINPILYFNRTDNYNNMPISASIIRKDLKNKDFKNFLAGYSYMLSKNYITLTDIEDYYNILINKIK